MKNSILLIVIFCCFISCKQTDEKKESNNRVNLLLPTTVAVSQLFVFDTTGSDWQKSFLSSNFISRVFDKFNKMELTVYDPNSDDSINKTCTKETVCNNMDVSSIPININEIKGMFIKEEWFLDTTEPFIFEKRVLNWSSVRFYKKNNEVRKKLVFKISGNDANEILAKNIIYEINLDDTVNPDFIKNINILKLSKLLIGKALSGKIKVYNVMNIDEELSFQQIKQRLGERIDTILTDDPESGKTKQQIIKSEYNPEDIKSIVFVEDWYYNTKTFAIKKVVKSIAPVRHYYKFGDYVKSISFVMFLTNEKIKIL